MRLVFSSEVGQGLDRDELADFEESQSCEIPFPVVFVDITLGSALHLQRVSSPKCKLRRPLSSP